MCLARNTTSTTRKLYGESTTGPLKEGANAVVLQPDVAKAFRDSVAVNDALRVLLRFPVRPGV